ncbi:hypothetical protein EYZ11_000975 [Aspergillus tanneri]|uniref:Uncharacterized protein n=1 Tax=Aspergillus tanneri TaxID=1220188 RepID=A0A4S3JVR6_9EURO|nr:hypothetical protein EYZ11_000975 [Aspergillus tanneri]
MVNFQLFASILANQPYVRTLALTQQVMLPVTVAETQRAKGLAGSFLRAHNYTGSTSDSTIKERWTISWKTSVWHCSFYGFVPVPILLGATKGR